MKKYWNLIQYALYVGLILGVTGFLMDFIIMPLYVREGQVVTLPDTQGMLIEEAISLLKDKGFNPVEKAPKLTTTFEAGRVYEQNPAPLSRVKKGRRVYLTPSLEERYIAVPDIIGLSKRNASLSMERAGFRIDSIFYDYSNRIPDGAIIAQSLPPDIEAKRGTPIWVTVSLGNQPDNFKVPKLLGNSLASAKELVAKSGLIEGEITYRIDEDLIPFTVLWQSLKAGTMLKKRVRINLIVSITDVSLIPELPEFEEEF
ncbi:MAG: PASTA domain-containing protein [Candidatus Marinimicrobia bacterium]|nr:PASTA domain-containing protein [Candidatus Neomarinimicrobiota bacterium]